MKNLKIITFVTIFFLGINQSDAQEKSVIIRGDVTPKNVEIITINENYEVTEKKYDRDKVSTDNEFLVDLKKELDKWLMQGYILTESNILTNGASTAYKVLSYSIFYVLTKKQ